MVGQVSSAAPELKGCSSSSSYRHRRPKAARTRIRGYGTDNEAPPPISAHPVTRRRLGLKRPPPRGPLAAERRHASKRPPAGRPLTRMPCSTRTRSSSSIPKDALRPSRLSALPMAGGGSGAPALTGPAPPANKTAPYWRPLGVQPIPARAAGHCGGCSLAAPPAGPGARGAASEFRQRAAGWVNEGAGPRGPGHRGGQDTEEAAPGGRSRRRFAVKRQRTGL